MEQYDHELMHFEIQSEKLGLDGTKTSELFSEFWELDFDKKWAKDYDDSRDWHYEFNRSFFKEWIEGRVEDDN